MARWKAIRPRHAVAAALIVAAVVVVALFALPRPGPATAFSFETDLEGWAPAGADLEHGGGTVPWSIEWTTERAKAGSASVKLFLDNVNDAGKIWIERSFAVAPGRAYRVTIEFSLASADFGFVNTWTVIAGALDEPPRSARDLAPAFRGTTANGADDDVGYVWLDRRVEETAASGFDGRLWIVLGVWGTWEGPRTYYIDEVRITVAGA